jgi:hypothetical protein
LAALTIVFICSTALCILLYGSVEAQSAASSAPAIEWQQVYSSQVLESSNLIQTADGGYVFMDLGYTYQNSLKPATLFKIDSTGNNEWNKTFNLFTGSRIIQTNDEGYEVSGWWHPNGTYSVAPTLIKTDSYGDIQWNRNYTALPDLGINFSEYMFPYISGNQRGGSVSTSDGGSVSWNHGNITKTTSHTIEWAKTLTYPTIDAYPTYTYPLMLTSVIETSDGSIAALGVGCDAIDNMYTGKIYLIQTEPFLPIPNQAPLPTTLPTLMPTTSEAPINSFALIAPFFIVILVLAIVSLLLYRKTSKNR